MIIALTGNDGSGKTTLCKELYRQLHANRKRVIRLEEFDYKLLGLLKKVLGQDQTSKTQSGIQNISTRPPLATKLLPYLMAIDSAVQTTYLKIFKRNIIVLKDRCVYDYLATWRELGVASRFVELLYRHLPKPDLTFYITVEPEVSLARRKLQPAKNRGKNLDFYTLKRSLYDTIYQANSLFLIDNNTNIQATLNEIQSYISLKTKLSKIKYLALSGLDGAGKSTTVEQFTKLLYKTNTEHRVIHFYYNYLPIKLLKKIKGKPQPQGQAASAQAYQTSIDHELKSKQIKRCKAWVAYVILDSLLQYYLARIFSPGKLIIFDRFFPDYYVSFDFLDAPYNKKLLERLLPKPGLYFLQAATPEILHSRKPEHTLEFFRQCHKSYGQMAKEQGMVILDSTTKNPDDLVADICRAITKRTTQ